MKGFFHRMPFDTSSFYDLMESQKIEKTTTQTHQDLEIDLSDPSNVQVNLFEYSEFLF